MTTRLDHLRSAMTDMLDPGDPDDAVTLDAWRDVLAFLDAARAASLDDGALWDRGRFRAALRPLDRPATCAGDAFARERAQGGDA